MSLANKSFRNNRTGDIVRVIDSFENIAILENKQKIDARTLMDSNQYTEQIDPGSFFNNQGAYNILAEKIKNIPTQNIRDEDGATPVVVNSSNSNFGPATNESAIVMSSEDDERAELARKYGVSSNKNDLERQNQAFAKLLGEEDSDVQKIEVQRDNPEPQVVKSQNKVYSEPVVQRVEVEDPIIKMFKGVKRNVDFNISIDINNKIPRLDFIEMMEDSYETSIIEFLSDEFTKEIVNNPGKIKSIISDKIKSMLDSKSVSDQITDSVTQINSNKEDVSFNDQKGEVKVEKTKTTRKPRTKKEN
jgi:hypothetical protein